MTIVNACYQLECEYNDYEKCTLLWGIEIDESGECINFEYGNVEEDKE